MAVKCGLSDGDSGPLEIWIIFWHIWKFEKFWEKLKSEVSKFYAGRIIFLKNLKNYLLKPQVWYQKYVSSLYDVLPVTYVL